MTEHIKTEQLSIHRSGNDINTVREVLKEAEEHLLSRGYTVCRLWYLESQYPDGFTICEFEGERPETPEERKGREQENEEERVRLKENRRAKYEELKREFEPQTTENKDKDNE